MYNKFIFINNNRRKKQEAQKAEENSQVSFDMLANAQNESNNAINNNASPKQKSNVIFKTGGVKRNNMAQSTNQTGKKLNRFIDDYVLVDIETTGLSPIYDDIIEIGAIKVENNKMVDEYSQLIKIDRILPQKITELTGITDNMLATGKMPKTVLEEFINFVGNNVIIGHNVNFDLGFLKLNKSTELEESASSLNLRVFVDLEGYFPHLQLDFNIPQFGQKIESGMKNILVNYNINNL